MMDSYTTSYKNQTFAFKNIQKFTLFDVLLASIRFKNSNHMMTIFVAYSSPTYGEQSINETSLQSTQCTCMKT